MTNDSECENLTGTPYREGFGGDGLVNWTGDRRAATNWDDKPGLAPRSALARPRLRFAALFPPSSFRRHTAPGVGGTREPDSGRATVVQLAVTVCGRQRAKTGPYRHCPRRGRCDRSQSIALHHRHPWCFRGLL